jgi:hypothetical protein
MAFSWRGCAKTIRNISEDIQLLSQGSNQETVENKSTASLLHPVSSMILEIMGYSLVTGHVLL